MDGDILTAIEDTMRNRPNGYFAQKFYDLFDKDDSPLNPKAEHFVNVTYVLKEFYKKIANMNKTMASVDKEAARVKTKLENLFKKLDKSATAFDKINKVIGQYVATINASAKKMVSGKTTRPIVNIKVEAKTIVDKLEDSHKKLITKLSEIPKPIVDSITKISKKMSQFQDMYRARTDTMIKALNRSKEQVNNFVALMAGLRKDFKDSKKESLLTPSVTNNNSVINNMPNKKGAWQSFFAYMDNSNKKDDKGSLIGRIFGFLFKAGIFLTGLGYLKKWLDSSETGKQIKEMVKNIFRNLSKLVGDWIDSGKFKEVLTGGVKMITDTLSFLFGGVYNFFKKHQDKIEDALSSSFDIVWNDILVPLWEGLKSNIKESFQKNFDKQKQKTGNDSFLDKILDPVVSALKTSVPYLLTLLTLRYFPIIGSLIVKPFLHLSATILKWVAWKPAVWGIKAALTQFGNILKWMVNPAKLPIKGNLLKLFGRAGIIGLIIIEMGWIANSVSGIIEKFKEQNKLVEQEIEDKKKILNKNKITLMQRHKDAEEAAANHNQDKTRESFIKMKLAQIKEKEIQIEIDKNEKLRIANEEYSNANWGHKLSAWIKLNDDTEKINNEFIRKQYDLLEKSKRKEFSQELRKLEEAKITKNIIKPSDAIIVQPHTKDQVVMAKKDGPIDLMMRDMVSKFDKMMGVMASGLGTVANVTSESGQSIVSAVLASGSKSSGNANDAFAGSDPIRDMRDRAQRIPYGYAQ